MQGIRDAAPLLFMTVAFSILKSLVDQVPASGPRSSGITRHDELSINLLQASAAAVLAARGTSPETNNDLAR